MEPSDLLSLVLDTEELCRDYGKLFIAHELTSAEVLADVTAEQLAQIGITNRRHAEHIIETRNRVFGQQRQKPAQPRTTFSQSPDDESTEDQPITLSLLSRCSPNYQKTLVKASLADLRTLAHLVLSGKGITRIDCLENCPAAQHLYLYENRITVIENLAPVARLKVLYLQSNRIRRLEGLSCLPSLQRLDISDNEIPVLEGLSQSQQLQELACNRQRLISPFLFEEESIVGISQSLLKLSLVGNLIEDVGVLWYLDAVQEVDLAENRVEFTEGLDKMLTCMRGLVRLVLKGNPVTRIPKYRDEVIMRNASVQELDGRDILANEREYLFRLKNHRNAPKPPPPAVSAKKYAPAPVRFKGAGKPKQATGPPSLEVTGKKP